MRRHKWDLSLENLLENTTPVPECGCFLWDGWLDTNGYGKVTGKALAVHRLVMEATLGRKLSGEEVVCHTCDVRSCINPRHMYVGSHTQNMADRNARGRVARGERIHTATLTDDAVREIRSFPEVTAREWAEKFGVTKSSIMRARSGRGWKHVPSNPIRGTGVKSGPGRNRTADQTIMRKLSGTGDK
jgi:hypothetical protein